MLILVRSIGVLILLLLATTTWLSLSQPAEKSADDKGPCRPTRGGIAMELVRSAAEGSAIADAPVAPDKRLSNREALKELQHRDFFFIAAYGLLFVAMGLLLARRPLPAAVWLGVAAGVLGLATALCDVQEDLSILRFLSLSVPTDADALAIRHAGLWKWGLFSATLVPLSALFFGRGHWVLSLIGALFLLTAGLGFAGLGCPRLLEVTFLTLAPGLLLTLVLCFGWPRLLT